MQPAKRGEAGEFFIVIQASECRGFKFVFDVSVASSDLYFPTFFRDLYVCGYKNIFPRAVAEADHP